MFEHVGETHSTRVLFLCRQRPMFGCDALLSLQRLQEISLLCVRPEGPRLSWVRSFLGKQGGERRGNGNGELQR